MKRSFKRFLSAVLALATVFGMIVFSPTASAVKSGDWEFTLSDDEAIITSYSGSSSSVTVPSILNGFPVTGIGDSAFDGCTFLSSVTIPDSVTNIGCNAFLDCTSLSNVELSEGLERIEGGAFGNCTSLASITIPATLTEAGWNYSVANGPFCECTSLKNVCLADGLTTVPAHLFAGCSGIESIVLPDTVETIEDRAFLECSSLVSVTIPDSVTSIGDAAFFGCDSLSDVYFGGTMEQWNRIDIGEDNDPLESATIHFADEHIHSYLAVVTAPTCTDQGYTTYTCSRCGDEYTDNYTDPLGHDYAETVTAPTCTEQGYTTHVCSRCGETYVDNYTDALGHDFVEETIAPTCTEEGYTAHTCSRCGDAYADTYTDALGHSFVGGVCAVCGAVSPDSAKAALENKRAKPGDKITVAVSIADAPPIRSLAISDITLGSPALTLLGVGWDIENLALSSWDAETGRGVAALTEARDINGKIVTLTVKIDDDAEDGDYSLSLNVIAKGENNTDVTFATAPGTVSVRSVLRGDLNGDEEVTDADAVYLLFYTFFPADYPLNQDADFNGDGVVSDADAIYILFHTFFPADYPLA
ncbi:MAG: leucine-rich repeat protein [Clostridia bacterium]|nr:leucine-rich repeat protein [Clostridia bacterium]